MNLLICNECIISLMKTLQESNILSVLINFPSDRTGLFNFFLRSYVYYGDFNCTCRHEYKQMTGISIKCYKIKMTLPIDELPSGYNRYLNIPITISVDNENRRKLISALS